MIVDAIGTIVSADPAPNPMLVSPAASPRRSGNHLSAFPTQVPYTAPAPMPPTTAAAYNIGSELANEFITHAAPTSNDASTTMMRGPNRSTRYPSIGTSHVSVSTNSVKATWIAARPHPCFALIGLTNSVHPYWRFAIIDMHSTPTNSCHHRPRDAARMSSS